MTNQELYFKREYDLDFSYLYWRMKEEVKLHDSLPNNNLIKSIDKLLKDADGCFYKGAYLCFSYKNLKYCISLRKYNFDLLEELHKLLINCGASNFFMNYGAID